MASQELQQPITSTQQVVTPLAVQDTASKPGHNKPQEAASYLKDITDLMDIFIKVITGFDRYAKQDAYPNYVFKLQINLWNLTKNILDMQV